MVSPHLHHPKQELICHWSGTQHNIILKPIAQESSSTISITYNEHFITEHQDIHLTPKRQQLILTGCAQSSYYPHDLRPRCVITSRTNNLIKFTNKKSTQHQYFKNINKTNYYIACKPLYSLKYIGSYKYNQQHQLSLPPHHYPTTTPLAADTLLKAVISQINDSLLCADTIKKSQLINIANSFHRRSNYIFYTDGSVLNLGTQQCSSGFGWLGTMKYSNKSEFKGSTVFLPSSTKAEAMALLTAIITLPNNSKKFNYLITKS